LQKEDKAMKDDLLLITGVLVGAALSVWYIVHAIAGVVYTIPADDACTTATQCFALAMGQ
jgi:uncharacterized membrane protein